MHSQKKQSWMVWAIVILGVMNLSTLITIVYHQGQARREEAAANQLPVVVETDAAKYSGRYFRDQLNLSPEKMNSFRELNPVFRRQAREINLELGRMRNEMLREMAARNPDTARLNELSDSIGKLHGTLKKITFRYYLDMKSLCNPDQQVKLEQIFGEVFSNDMLMGPPGQGPGMGRGRGPRWNRTNQ